MIESMSVVVNIMLSLMSVMSPPPALCNLLARTVVKLYMFDVWTGGVLNMCLCFGCCSVDQGLKGCGGVMSASLLSPDSLCRWQVQVSVYCAWRIPAHLILVCVWLSDLDLFRHHPLL